MGNNAFNSRNRLKRRDMFFVNFENLKIVEGFNVRYDYGDIEELANSIEQNGVKVPLRGYKEGETFYITDGHRRYKALQLLNKKGLEISAPFVSEVKGYNDEQRTLDLVITNDGKRLTLLEEAEVYGRLLNYGWGVAEIAKKVGKSITHISNCTLLLEASTLLKKQIREDKVSASTVIEMLKKDGTAEVEEQVAEAVKSNKGKRVTNKHIKKPVAPKLKREKKFTIDDLVALQDKLDNESVTGEVEVNQSAFDTLDALIKYGQGRIGLMELGNVFFNY